MYKYFLLLLIVVNCEKQVEKCLQNALNKTDKENKGI